MTEPTDAELDTVLCNQWPAFSMQATLVRVWVRAAMRDALAKWGTPPAVAGEPVATLHCNQDCYVWARATEAGKLLRFEDPMNLYTTPQPTQAQAGAVPLTDEQIDAVAESMPGGLAGFLKGWGWRQFAREILTLRRMPDWEPQFDCMTPKQEELAIQFCQEIAGPRGKRGSPPDPVRLLEMAEALYKAEREHHHGIKGGQHGAE